MKKIKLMTMVVVIVMSATLFMGCANKLDEKFVQIENLRSEMLAIEGSVELIVDLISDDTIKAREKMNNQEPGRILPEELPEVATRERSTKIDTDSVLESVNTRENYAELYAPIVYHTMGGVEMNTKVEELKKNRDDIKNEDVEICSEDNAENTMEIEKDEYVVVPEINGGYTDGVYTRIVNGKGGDIIVNVTVEGGNIINVELTDNREKVDTYKHYKIGVVDVVNEIIRTQTTEVDSVTGATEISDDIKSAVAEAIKDAK